MRGLNLDTCTKLPFAKLEFTRSKNVHVLKPAAENNKT